MDRLSLSVIQQHQKYPSNQVVLNIYPTRCRYIAEQTYGSICGTDPETLTLPSQTKVPVSTHQPLSSSRYHHFPGEPPGKKSPTRGSPFRARPATWPPSASRLPGEPPGRKSPMRGSPLRSLRSTVFVVSGVFWFWL